MYLFVQVPGKRCYYASQIFNIVVVFFTKKTVSSIEEEKQIYFHQRNEKNEVCVQSIVFISYRLFD